MFLPFPLLCLCWKSAKPSVADWKVLLHALCENDQYRQRNRFVKCVLQTSWILTQKSALCALKHTVIQSSLTEHLGQREMQICNLGCQNLQRIFGGMKYELPYMTISHSCHAPTCFCRPPPPGTSQQRSLTCMFLRQRCPGDLPATTECSGSLLSHMAARSRMSASEHLRFA